MKEGLGRRREKVVPVLLYSPFDETPDMKDTYLSI